jgi:hypothetical protein
MFSQESKTKNISVMFAGAPFKICDGQRFSGDLITTNGSLSVTNAVAENQVFNELCMKMYDQNITSKKRKQLTAALPDDPSQVLENPSICRHYKKRCNDLPGIGNATMGRLFDALRSAVVVESGSWISYVTERYPSFVDSINRNYSKHTPKLLEFKSYVMSLQESVVSFPDACVYFERDVWQLIYGNSMDKFVPRLFHHDETPYQKLCKFTTVKSRTELVLELCCDLGLDVAMPPHIELIGRCKQYMNKHQSIWMPLQNRDRAIIATRMQTFRFRNHHITFAKHFQIEKHIADVLKRIAVKFTDDVDVECKSKSICDEEQTKAIRLAIGNGVSCIFGGAGVGKTRVAGELAKQLGMDTVIGAAPTGKAANRLSECFGGEQTYTMHRLLFTRLEAVTEHMSSKVNLIVDEQSMQDQEIYAEVLLKYEHVINRVIHIGDVAQLPSISAGSLFRELIKASPYKSHELRKIYRTDGGAVIAMNSQKVRFGKLQLQYTPGKFEKYTFASAQQVADHCDGERGTRSMVLCQTRKMVASLNPLLRNIALPDHLSIRERTNEFKFGYKNGKKPLYCWSYVKGDRVLCIKNMYIPCDELDRVVLEICNGEIGTVIAASLRFITVLFDNQKEFMFDSKHVNNQTKELVNQIVESILPAYAMTVHKAQGSEYDKVVFICERFGGASRSMLYTAISRAKNKCVVFDKQDGVRYSINTPLATRKSMIFDDNELQL